MGCKQIGSTFGAKSSLKKILPNYQQKELFVLDTRHLDPFPFPNIRNIVS